MKKKQKLKVYYPEKLINIIKNSKVPYIPKKLSCVKNRKYFLYHRYYIEDFNNGNCYFKIIDIIHTDKEKYVEITFSDSLFWILPICPNEDEIIYELCFDINNINKIEDIVNYKKFLYGYEIRYWFYNNYNFKYKNFKSYIEEIDNKSSINNFLKYKFIGDYKCGIYTNCKVIKEI